MSWATAKASVDPAFVAQACAWLRSPARSLLRFVWSGYDQMIRDQPFVDGRDLERSISQLLEPRIRDAMSGYEPFYVQHEAYERETMAPQPAQPPAYDLAFVWRTDERVMWPLEAKIMTTPGNVAPYADDIRDQFLSCRYAPFTTSGAMIGYLLSGTSVAALSQIATKMGVVLEKVAPTDVRAQRVSRHQRSVPTGKTYSASFDCYHLILEYPALSRTRPTAVPPPAL